MIGAVLRRNYTMLAEALCGTADARRLHADHRAEPATISAGIQAIERRWPDLDASNDAPIFVLGAGWRTGSTLLQRMITADDLLMWGEPYSHCALVETIASQVRAFNALWPWSEFFISYHEESNLQNTWIANLYPDIQQLKNAHTAYFDALFADPARHLNKSQWGVKEVLLTVEHAAYLRWLYPRAKFIFLYRDPYHAWASYRHWRSWYRRWPDLPVHTPSAFGRLWQQLTRDFVDNHEKVGGLLVRYEDLGSPATQNAIADYLGRTVTSQESLAQVAGGSGDTARSTPRYVPRLEKRLLARQVEPLSLELGYSPAS